MINKVQRFNKIRKDLGLPPDQPTTLLWMYCAETAEEAEEGWVYFKNQGIAAQHHYFDWNNPGYEGIRGYEEYLLRQNADISPAEARLAARRATQPRHRPRHTINKLPHALSPSVQLRNDTLPRIHQQETKAPAIKPRYFCVYRIRRADWGGLDFFRILNRHLATEFNCSNDGLTQGSGVDRSGHGLHLREDLLSEKPEALFGLLSRHPAVHHVDYDLFHADGLLHRLNFLDDRVRGADGLSRTASCEPGLRWAYVGVLAQE